MNAFADRMTPCSARDFAMAFDDDPVGNSRICVCSGCVGNNKAQTSHAATSSNPKKMSFPSVRNILGSLDDGDEIRVRDADSDDTNL